MTASSMSYKLEHGNKEEPMRSVDQLLTSHIIGVKHCNHVTHREQHARNNYVIQQTLTFSECV